MQEVAEFATLLGMVFLVISIPVIALGLAVRTKVSVAAGYDELCGAKALIIFGVSMMIISGALLLFASQVPFSP